MGAGETWVENNLPAERQMPSIPERGTALASIHALPEHSRA